MTVQVHVKHIVLHTVPLWTSLHLSFCPVFRGVFVHNSAPRFWYTILTSPRKVVLQIGWPSRQLTISLSISNLHSLLNPQQLNLSWISVFRWTFRLFQAAPRKVSSKFVVWGRARVAADTANNTKPVSPSTTMYYSIKFKEQHVKQRNKIIPMNNGMTIPKSFLYMYYRYAGHISIQSDWPLYIPFN